MKIISWIGTALGMLLLRSLLLIGAVVVFGAGLYMSWNHTYHLAESAGLYGSLATAYTIFAEVILSMSEITIIFLLILNRKVAWQIWLGLGFGLSIILWANIASLSFVGLQGVLIGISIPVGTAIASMIFATALTKQPTEKQAVKKPAETTGTEPKNETAWWNPANWHRNQKDTENETPEENKPVQQKPKLTLVKSKKKVKSAEFKNSANQRNDNENQTLDTKVQTEKPVKKSNNNPSQPIGELELARLKKVYDQIKEEYSKCGRDRLAKTAGISVPRARKAIDFIRNNRESETKPVRSQRSQVETG